MNAPQPQSRPTSHRLSDEELMVLHEQVREAGAELQTLLDELLRRVAAIYEGSEDDATAAEALAQIQSLRDDNS